MKKGSKLAFDNILLKQWLIKVGKERRQAFFAKFRADLARLGLSRFAWRKGLLQLFSQPFVRIIRVATTQTIRRGLMKGPKSRNKETQASKDDNNNIDLVGRTFDQLSFLPAKEHRKNYKEKLTKVVDIVASSECSASGAVSAIRHSLTVKLKKVGTTRESEDRYSVGSEKNTKDRERLRGKQKHRIPEKGENPNSITWRLIPLDMENPIKSPNLKILQHRQIHKKRKKDRLYAKFREIFGEDDADPPSSGCSHISNTETNETFGAPIPKKAITSKGKGPTQQKSDTLNRKSPIFADPSSKKRRRDSHAAVPNSEKKLKTADVDNMQDSISSDDKSSDTLRDYLIDILQGDTVSTESSCSTDRVSPNQPTVNSENAAVVGDLDTDDYTTSSSTTEILHPNEERDASSKNNFISEEEIRRKVLDLFGLNSESDQEFDVTGIASPIPQKLPPSPQEQRDSTTESDPEPQSEMVTNQEADLPIHLEIETSSLNASENDDDRSIIEISVNNEKLKKSSLPETLITSLSRSMKNEPVSGYTTVILPTGFLDPVPPLVTDQQPLITTSKNWVPNVIEDNPKPSSTTDMELNSTSGNETALDSARLLGALDNIYLALDCRRRVCEREQAASKLAIEKNRQEVVLNAKREFQSKLVNFREEITYLLTKLNTWDSVLRFISQGLDHRTPSGMKPFSPAEVELTMIETGIKVQVEISQKEFTAPVTKIKSVGEVLCTIDLTSDNKEYDVVIDLCDSSTDPPRSENHSIVKPESEPIIDDSPKNKIEPHYGYKGDFPSIADVKTISPQQFDRIDKSEDNFDTVSSRTNDPCYLCSRTSIVACGRCAQATYCSDICHKIHWKQSHYATCVPIPEILSCCQKINV